MHAYPNIQDPAATHPKQVDKSSWGDSFLCCGHLPADGKCGVIELSQVQFQVLGWDWSNPTGGAGVGASEQSAAVHEKADACSADKLLVAGTVASKLQVRNTSSRALDYHKSGHAQGAG